MNVYGLEFNAKGIQKHYSNVLGSPLNNPRFSWGSYDEARNIVFLTVWENHLEDEYDVRQVHVHWQSPKKGRPIHGYKERQRHLARINAGAPAFGVVARAKPNGRGIHSFDGTKLLRLGRIREESSGSPRIVAEVMGVLPIEKALHEVTTEALFASSQPDAIYRLVKQRQGQSAFRQQLISAYRQRCAMTGSNVEPALEAAHISPYSESGCHHINNGLLLRADVHTLFDLHFISVNPDAEMAIQVHPRIRKEYGNLHGKQLAQTSKPAQSPNLDRMRQHFIRFQQKLSLAVETSRSSGDI